MAAPMESPVPPPETPASDADAVVTDADRILPRIWLSADDLARNLKAMKLVREFNV